MTANQTTTVEQIYYSSPETAISARAILSFSKGLQYSRYPYDFETTRMMNTYDEEINDTLTSTFNIYPNPANEYATVEINFNCNEVGELFLYNVLGMEISRKTVLNHHTIVIDTRSLNNGMYVFVLKAGSQIHDKKKIIVSR